jgi:DNA-binding MurR/RpiR family transcriptional regulator
MLIQLNKEVFENLSASERDVIDFINHNEQAVLNMSITNIARKSYTSAATVSRAIQKSGFAGIAQLRYKIGENSKSLKQTESPYHVNEILLKSFRECKKTIDNIPIGSILKVIQYIDQAERIFIYARGFTVLIAEEFQQDLQLLGYNAILMKDVMWMKNTDKFISSKDAAVIFSVRTSTPEILTSAKMIHTTGAKLVTCCCISPTKLSDYSNVMLIGHSEVIMKSHGLEVYSKVPLFIIARTLIEYISNYRD